MQPDLVQLGAGPRPAAPGLVDRFDRRVRYLRVSLTDRCNYRCTYCMPEGPGDHSRRAEVLSFEELTEVVRGFVRRGVERVRLTGGEPTIRKNLPDLVARLAALALPAGGRLEVVMTTNGERLEELAAPLARAGLAGVTVSLDSRDPARFRKITRRGNVDRVLAGIAAAQASGLGPVRINTVAMRGFNDDELGDLVKWAWSQGHVPRFIELMPMSGGELYAPGKLMSAAEVRDTVAVACDATVVEDDGRGVAGSGPATYACVDGGPWHGKRFGTIAAMTENFCASCNRLRLSATGDIQGCLARDDAAQVRDGLRAGRVGALDEAVSAVLATKKERHGFELDGSGGPNKAMVSIGG